LNDLPLPCQRTDHRAEDLELIGLTQVPERKARNNGVDGSYSGTRKDARSMSCFAAANSNSREVCLEETREHRIALNDKQAFWPEATPQERSGDSTRARTDFEYGRLRRIYS
jgi:hypothetical protein